MKKSYMGGLRRKIALPATTVTQLDIPDQATTAVYLSIAKFGEVDMNRADNGIGVESNVNMRFRDAVVINVITEGATVYVGISNTLSDTQGHFVALTSTTPLRDRTFPFGKSISLFAFASADATVEVLELQQG